MLAIQWSHRRGHVELPGLNRIVERESVKKAKKGQEIPRNRACETSERARMDHRQWCRWPVGPSKREKNSNKRERRWKLPGAVLSYSLRSSRATKTGETDSTVVSLSRKILSCSSPHHQETEYTGGPGGEKSRNRFSSLDNARDTTSSRFVLRLLSLFGLKDLLFISSRYSHLSEKMDRDNADDRRSCHSHRHRFGKAWIIWGEMSHDWGS